MKGEIALALYSGGLDSILACRIIQAQGIEVRALKFVTPFFDHHLLAVRDAYCAEVRQKYGFDVHLVDLSEGYIDLLQNPAHGFGKNFNPCIDCKILMLTRARQLLDHYQASFLITGEVLGQRPMSQRRDTLRVIERDSGCEDILLRPLCAKRLPPTLPERAGWVDRDRLYGFTGRGRRPQLDLAREFDITDFPAPAGGCVLTDPNLADRIKRFYAGLFMLEPGQFQVNDFRLLLVGRQFRLPGGHWLVLGRNKRENEQIRAMAGADDWLLYMETRPGPTALLRRAGQLLPATAGRDEVVTLAAGLVVRYGKKTGDRRVAGDVLLEQADDRRLLPLVAPLEDTVFQPWIV